MSERCGREDPEGNEGNPHFGGVTAAGSARQNYCDAEIRAAVQRDLLETFEENHEGDQKIFKGVFPSFHKSHFNNSSVVYNK